MKHELFITAKNLLSKNVNDIKKSKEILKNLKIKFFSYTSKM